MIQVESWVELNILEECDQKKDIDQTDLHLSKVGNPHLKGGWGISSIH